MSADVRGAAVAVEKPYGKCQDGRRVVPRSVLRQQARAELPVMGRPTVQLRRDSGGDMTTEPGWTSSSVNEYGTPITRLACRTCERPFTVCPALPPERLDEWQHCMADDCPSYDIDRDPTYLFEPDEPGLHERSA